MHPCLKVLPALALGLATGCESIASRQAGNIQVTVNQYGPARDGQATPTPGGEPMTGAVNVMIVGNTANQEAGKTVDALKGAATVAASGQGTADAAGSPAVTTPPATVPAAMETEAAVELPEAAGKTEGAGAEASPAEEPNQKKETSR